MIKARQISKIYGGTAALSDVDLTLEHGQILGIVGTNGSGRTTLLRILATQLKPTSGQMEIDGIDALKHPFRARSKIGYIAQSQSFHDSMTVGEFFKFVASCQNEKLAKSSILAEQPFDGLSAEMPLRSLSHGSRQKLALTAILIHKPSLLILDEPLNHLDPIAAGQFQRLAKDFRFQGGTIAMACNRTADIPALCDEVAFMHQGRILQITKLAGLERDISEMFMELIKRDGEERDPTSAAVRIP
jgi:ABC-2 type transport system ATP-binding protein